MNATFVRPFGTAMMGTGQETAGSEQL